MNRDLKDLLRKMKTDHEKQRDRLEVWKEGGVNLENFPEGETIDDMIRREQDAVENLRQAIERL